MVALVGIIGITVFAEELDDNPYEYNASYAGSDYESSHTYSSDNTSLVYYITTKHTRSLRNVNTTLRVPISGLYIESECRIGKSSTNYDSDYDSRTSVAPYYLSVSATEALSILKKMGYTYHKAQVNYGPTYDLGFTGTWSYS